MYNGWHDLDGCIAFNNMTFLNMRREAKPCLNRSYAIVAMKPSHQNIQQRIVQEEETVVFVWQIIRQVYMDTESEGRVKLKVMMIQGRLAKTNVLTSKMFNVNQVELEKFFSYILCLLRSDKTILTKRD